MTSPPQTTHPRKIQHTRRDFLTRTSRLAGGIFAFGLPFFNDRTRPVFAMQSRKTIQNVRYWLELDGAIVGPLNSMESGFVSGEIITYSPPSAFTIQTTNYHPGQHNIRKIRGRPSSGTTEVSCSSRKLLRSERHNILTD